MTRQPYMDDSDYIKELEAKVKQLQAENESLEKAIMDMKKVLEHRERVIMSLPKAIVCAHPYPYNLD